MYRYAAPAAAATASTGSSSLEAIGSADPAIDAELVQFYAELLRRLGVTHSRAPAQLDRRRELPPRLRRAAERSWLDAHRDRSTRRLAHKRATSPLQVFDTKDERLRAALADAPTIGESLCARLPGALRRGARPSSTPTASATRSTRCSCAGSTTTRARRSSSSDRGERRTRTICGGGRYDGLVEAVGGPPTPGIGFGAGVERLTARARGRGCGAAEPARSTSSSRSTARTREQILALTRRAAPPRASPATPTTRAARSRAS